VTKNTVVNWESTFWGHSVDYMYLYFRPLLITLMYCNVIIIFIMSFDISQSINTNNTKRNGIKFDFYASNKEAAMLRYNYLCFLQEHRCDVGPYVFHCSIICKFIVLCSIKRQYSVSNYMSCSYELITVNY